MKKCFTLWRFAFLPRALRPRRERGRGGQLAGAAGEDHRRLHAGRADRPCCTSRRAKLTEQTGKNFYIENIPGAGGDVGAAKAAQSPPDGYTILVTGGNLTNNPFCLRVPLRSDEGF